LASTGIPICSDLRLFPAHATGRGTWYSVRTQGGDFLVDPPRERGGWRPGAPCPLRKAIRSCRMAWSRSPFRGIPAVLFSEDRRTSFRGSRSRGPGRSRTLAGPGRQASKRDAPGPLRPPSPDPGRPPGPLAVRPLNRLPASGYNVAALNPCREERRVCPPRRRSRSPMTSASCCAARPGKGSRPSNTCSPAC